MRVLALDYGSARCGCALSDPTGTLATPIEPVAAAGDAQRASRALARRWCASARSSASSSGCRWRCPATTPTQTREARAFAGTPARAARTDVPSSSTTSASRRRIAAAGRRARASEDSRAAAVLLEDWLARTGGWRSDAANRAAEAERSAGARGASVPSAGGPDRRRAARRSGAATTLRTCGAPAAERSRTARRRRRLRRPRKPPSSPATASAEPRPRAGERPTGAGAWRRPGRPSAALGHRPARSAPASAAAGHRVATRRARIAAAVARPSARAGPIAVLRRSLAIVIALVPASRCSSRSRATGRADASS